MKIRNKIVFTFVGLVSIVLLFSFSLIYYLSIHHMEKDFFSLILEKANLTAWKYFEEDEMSATVYSKVMQRYAVCLPESEEIVLDTKNKQSVKDSLLKILPNNLVNNILDGKTINFLTRVGQGVGIYYPDNQGNFVVIITAINKFGLQQQHNLLEFLLIIFFGSIVFIFLIGRLYAANVLYPIVNILKNVKRIRATNLSLRLKEINRNDELAELVRTFNQMLDRLENSFTLQKDFINNASHELKNPLTAILGVTEITLSKIRSPKEYVNALTSIMVEAERLDQLTRNLLSLAQADFDISAIKMEDISIDELIIEVIEHFDNTNYKGRIEIDFPVLPEFSDLLTIKGNSNLLKTALINLIDNACKFSGDKKVNITLATDNNGIHIRITDQGIGLPENEAKKIFQPFFRASNALSYSGLGVGLSLVHKIITMHSGEILFSSNYGIGTSVEINFPIKQKQK